MSGPVLEVRDLTVQFKDVEIVNKISFDLHRGETLCIVGESGSGKSVTSRAIMRIEKPGKITSGKVVLRPEGEQAVDVTALDAASATMRSIRGGRISMIFQEPMSSLSPVHTIGQQIIEAIQLHSDVTPAEARLEAIEALRRVQIPNPEHAIDQYAFEFSGGMRQRAMIAMALSCKPDVLIADEPTTALDVTTQAEILRLIKRLQTELGMAVIFITHDMGVVAEIADRVAVMYRGELVETGAVEDIFSNPEDSYTRRLIEASSKFTILGDHNRGGALPADDPSVLLELKDVDLTFRKKEGFLVRKVHENHALQSVSISLREGENLGIVGESGSGKTTLVRTIVGLLRADAGEALYYRQGGEPVDLLKPGALRALGLNREIRMIFQDPFSSLNPRMTVEQVIGEPLLMEGKLSREAIRERVAELLDKVGLSSDMMSRYPHAFSGGQRQRISIARALAVNPRIIIADEATSALDGSIRSQILDLMFDLQVELSLSYIFVGHDLGVVRYFCDRIAVMRQGQLVELGSAADICQRPQADYTRALIAAVPATRPSDRHLIPQEGLAS